MVNEVTLLQLKKVCLFKCLDSPIKVFLTIIIEFNPCTLHEIFDVRSLFYFLCALSSVFPIFVFLKLLSRCNSRSFFDVAIFLRNLNRVAFLKPLISKKLYDIINESTVSGNYLKLQIVYLISQPEPLIPILVCFHFLIFHIRFI